MTSGSNKRKIEVDYEDLLKPIQLIPQSQWVYSTPDKQKIRKIVAQDTSKPQIMPAVYHTNKKMKVLYNLKEELVGKMNVDKFATGETVQIDKRFLRPICEVTLGESSNNQFLSSDSEHSIDIKDVNLTLSTTANETLKELEKEDDPAIAWVGGSHENDITIDFESNVYHVCTQRPAKTVKKSTRLNTFERRTLSFDETPKRTPNLVQKHKSDSILALSQGKMAFQDRSNLMIDPDQPSTSKSIVFRQQTPHPSLDEKDVENMCLISDNCASVVNSDCEFFGENLWPDMPELLSPKHLEMFPRKM